MGVMLGSGIDGRGMRAWYCGVAVRMVIDLFGWDGGDPGRVKGGGPVGGEDGEPVGGDVGGLVGEPVGGDVGV